MIVNETSRHLSTGQRERVWYANGVQYIVLPLQRICHFVRRLYETGNRRPCISYNSYRKLLPRNCRRRSNYFLQNTVLRMISTITYHFLNVTHILFQSRCAFLECRHYEHIYYSPNYVYFPQIYTSSIIFQIKCVGDMASVLLKCIIILLCITQYSCTAVINNANV